MEWTRVLVTNGSEGREFLEIAAMLPATKGGAAAPGAYPEFATAPIVNLLRLSKFGSLCIVADACAGEPC